MRYVVFINLKGLTIDGIVLRNLIATCWKVIIMIATDHKGISDYKQSYPFTLNIKFYNILG